MDEANELRGSLQLIGTVKSVIFQNEENDYTVLRLDVGGDEPVTVVGCLPFAAPGEGLTVEGAWERHPSHGEQFKASSAMRSLPVGAKMMTLETGVRFLTDYLDGDVYFKVACPDHNLVRARTQLKLLQDMDAHWDEMVSVIGELGSRKKGGA